MQTWHTFVLHVFGATVRVETNCADVLSSLTDEWADWTTAYEMDGPVTTIRVTRYWVELEFCHARHRYLTQEAATAWPCRKCVGDIFFDSSPVKRFLCYTPDTGAIVSEVGWIISHVIHRHLDPSTIAMHASSVVDDKGNGVMFVGPSDAGKSTLASLMVARGWRLVANETTYVGVGDPVHIRGLPSRIELEPLSRELVARLSGIDATAADCNSSIDRPGSSEAEATLRMIVLPALTPDRQLQIAASPAEHTLRQLALRRIDYAIYHESQSSSPNWANFISDRIPAWTVEGRLDSMEAPDWIARASVPS